MLRRNVSGIMLALVLTTLLILTGKMQPAEASGTIYIRADGSIDPPTANIASSDNVTYYFTDNINETIMVERNNIVIDGAGYTVQGTAQEGRGLDLRYNRNVTIRSMEVREFQRGIYMGRCANITVYGNRLPDNFNAVYLDRSQDCTVFGNDIAANWVGVLIGSSTTEILSKNNTIFGNNITDHEYGVLIENDLGSNFVSGNSITNNRRGSRRGIEISRSDPNNIITGNYIFNAYLGIYIQDWSDGNIFCGNEITNNSLGVGLGNSDNNVFLGNNITYNDVGARNYRSINNKFYHNTFINNTEQALSYEPGYTNIWDDGYPSGGNYWSDYNGTDSYSGPHQNETGSDGIGDTPYFIDVNNQDNYPLINRRLSDVAVIDVIPLHSVVGQGLASYVNVTVANEGNYYETFNVALYANTTIIQTETITLSSGNHTTVAFLWNTASFAKGNYTLEANATITCALRETDLTDNTLTDGWVIVAMIGDITGPDGLPDGKCDMRDIGMVARGFGANRVTNEADPKYGEYWHPTPCDTCPHNPNCDVVYDGKIDMRDIGTVARHFGETDP